MLTAHSNDLEAQQDHDDIMENVIMSVILSTQMTVQLLILAAAMITMHCFHPAEEADQTFHSTATIAYRHTFFKSCSHLMHKSILSQSSHNFLYFSLSNKT